MRAAILEANDLKITASQFNANPKRGFPPLQGHYPYFDEME
jgi:hypothetical protein